MPKMFRLNHDGTVDVVDDTPDKEWLGPKYMRSTMRQGMWVFCNYYMMMGVTQGERMYVHESCVPEVIKMFDLLEP